MNYSALPKGWYEEDELCLLEACAKAVPPYRPFVEIGVAHGRSATLLATYTEELFLCDNLSMGDHRVEWPPCAGVYTDAYECLRRLPVIGLLHHDAAHTYDVVLGHLRAALPKIVVGGFVCLHDYFSASYPEVQKAWCDAVVHAEWEAAGQAGTLMCFKRIA